LDEQPRPRGAIGENRSMIRVILADDHAVMRDGLRHILETAGGFDIVGEASDGDATLALAERHTADVLLLDLSMPGRPAST
jgi:DNA-binding NarL/FixJ family response regulator